METLPRHLCRSTRRSMLPNSGAQQTLPSLTLGRRN
jgi:hypothetical protein